MSECKFISAELSIGVHPVEVGQNKQSPVNTSNLLAKLYEGIIKLGIHLIQYVYTRIVGLARTIAYRPAA